MEDTGASKNLSPRRAITKCSPQIDNESNMFLVRQGGKTTRKQKVDMHS